MLERGSEDVNLKFAKKAMEIDYIKRALSRNNGVVSRAAKDLGISRVNLYDLIDKYNIQIAGIQNDAPADQAATYYTGGLLVWKL